MPATGQAFQFLDDLVLATLLIVSTATIHAVLLDRIMVFVGLFIGRAQGNSWLRHGWKIGLGIVTVLGIFLSHTLHIWLWALTYHAALDLPELQTLEDSVYFSTVTYATLGYGDIVLKDSWRVLSGIEAANGIVMFGWSTAFLFEVMSMLYPRGRLK
jgi:hypothetical protein